MRRIAFFALLTILLAGCGTFEETVTVVHQEELCEPWADDFTTEYNDTQTKRNIKRFFRQNRLTAYEVRVSDDPQASLVLCGVCRCKNGRLIECEVKKEQLEDFEALGFELLNE
jgi:hypothetical protein